MQQTSLNFNPTTHGSQQWRHMHRQMPLPQYLGAKHKILPWICEFIPSGASTVLDGFSGSQSFAFEMKKRGCAVYANDFLSFCHIAGVALVENSQVTLTENDLTLLFSEVNSNRQHRKTMTRFADIFFIKSECDILDNFRVNVELLDCPYKRALALAVMCRSMTRKTTMGHFAHLCAIPYASDPARVKRNPNIARSIRDVFMQLVPHYNKAVFDNGQKSKSHRTNILDFLRTFPVNKIDFAYYDPPYCNSHSDYQAFYHLLETFVEQWTDKVFINRTCRYHPPRYSGFDKMSEIEKSFQQLFALSDEIPSWLISYNDRSFPRIETLARMAKRHKSVRIENRVYKSARGGRGSVAGSREYLLICE